MFIIKKLKIRYFSEKLGVLKPTIESEIYKKVGSNIFLQFKNASHNKITNEKAEIRV